MSFRKVSVVLLIAFIIITESSGKSLFFKHACLEHIDCPDRKPACFDSVCMDLCEGACGINAICRLRERVTPVCYCPDGMIGDPFIKCMTPDVKLISCEAHSDCPGNKYRCIHDKCVDSHDPEEGNKNNDIKDQKLLINSIEKLTKSTNKIADMLEKLLNEYEHPIYVNN